MEESEAVTRTIKPVFKKKNKAFRKRKGSSESDGEQDESESFRSILEDTKELQSLRRKPHGVSVLGLAVGKNLSSAEEMVIKDPFKLKSGGMIDMKNLKVQAKNAVEEFDAVNLGNTFSVETNRRDEDADMMKYIDEELAKRKGVTQKAELLNSQSKAEDVLFQVPEHLRLASSSQSEEMLSNQMLSGIPEVDLGIEERIRNIESTEEAKQRLLKDRLRKKESGTSFVPTNMAVNFVQHNRFNIEDGEQTKFAKPVAPVVGKAKRKQQPVVVISETDTSTTGPGHKRHGGKKPDDDKATDDFHFEKFKKQFRRY